MGHAVVDTITHGDHNAQLFTGSELNADGALFVGQGHPAGIQAQRLSVKHDLLSIVTAPLIQVGGFFPGKYDVISHPGKLAVVGHRSVKGCWLICDELQAEAALPGAPADKIPQFFCRFPFDWTGGVGTHRMALLHRLYQIHRISSY